MSPGVLITAKMGDKVNPMTIGWGSIGVEWGKPLFTAYVRPCRYTHEMIEVTGEFTVNVPMGNVKNILGFCGTKSGRDTDKVAELCLTLEDPVTISAPGIKELPLTLECRVVYKQDQVLAHLQDDLRDRYYPDRNDLGDYHTAYYAEIVNAYMIED
jgi:flavin reductase (DIM6/NTAB) family NADH-FMN oxidoreductase RutF